jgi:hypothetical protein
VGTLRRHRFQRQLLLLKEEDSEIEGASPDLQSSPVSPPSPTRLRTPLAIAKLWRGREKDRDKKILAEFYP